MLAASIQCWWMLRALRSHGRRWLVVSSDEMRPYLSFSNFFCDWPSVDLDLSTAPYTTRNTFASPVERRLLWSCWQRKRLRPLKRLSLSTIVSLHDMYNFIHQVHLLPTCLRSLSLHCVFFYHTTLTSRLKFSRNSLLVVVPWRHHLVIVLWLNSQYNRFLRCKQARDATSRCQRLKPNII